MSPEDLFKGSRGANGRWIGWHERWCRDLLSREEVDALATVASEGAHGEILTWTGNVEYTKWPSGETTTVTKQWYLDNIYKRSNDMVEKQAIDDIKGFCTDIREILASAELDDEAGISDMLRDVRIRLDNIEGKVAELKGRNDKTETHSAFKTGDIVRYRGVLCRVEAVIDRNDGLRPWIWYDLREQYGDGEYLDVPESAIVKTSESEGKGKKTKNAFQRFFQVSNCEGDDVWLNLFRICYVIGKEVTMADGETFALTAEEAEDLVRVIGCKHARNEHDAK